METYVGVLSGFTKQGKGHSLTVSLTGSTEY